uniref:GST N-terminal domain-containing protein n=1 Tax=Chromera velia CCMP2878 TaxID=1169474 RepID=A0A0G4GYG6_9ALVE|mmetsp:Transcript_37158/g.73119  ORF Transcript_37158/g.73119 Transcript_37158/m.73119 type:complete len:174 (-) Transcript_37158:841-1362(-)|eukprot:Cvel_23906.t1-p1 / transcript=Cvel_23906.t1 / gene=Cvel_23906 / organism=Chromera_velia_CCMP2878 / gene_product=hypothetical protein / transcript_product=hypothetical protein / location=Cvel_scaffold2521:8426-9856(+) / protein_length=173 / sequence_SO=supercontig / SO=protein_coding / is_pseudo=false
MKVVLQLALFAVSSSAFLLRGGPVTRSLSSPAARDSKTALNVVYSFESAMMAVTGKKDKVTAFYYFPECTFCKKIFDWAEENGLDLESKGITLKNIRDENGDPSEYGYELVAKASGKKQVPAIEIGGRHIMQESGDIMALFSKIYLDKEMERKLSSGSGIKVESYMEIADLLD